MHNINMDTVHVAIGYGPSGCRLELLEVNCQSHVALIFLLVPSFAYYLA